jgi:hypothetical protein
MAPNLARVAGLYARYAGPSQELKFFQTVQGVVTPTAGGTILSSINLLDQGAGASERVGRKCVVKSLHIKGRMKLSATAANTTTADSIRFVIYLDTQTNGTAATPSEIFDATAGSAPIHGYRNLANTQRFKILYDKTMDIKSTSGAYDGAQPDFGEAIRSFKINKRCYIPLEFSNPTGALVNIRSNNIGILMFAREASANVGFETRIRFADY